MNAQGVVFLDAKIQYEKLSNNLLLHKKYVSSHIIRFILLFNTMCVQQAFWIPDITEAKLLSLTPPPTHSKYITQYFTLSID